MIIVVFLVLPSIRGVISDCDLLNLPRLKLSSLSTKGRKSRRRLFKLLLIMVLILTVNFSLLNRRGSRVKRTRFGPGRIMFILWGRF